jgi:hypothetical protein
MGVVDTVVVDMAEAVKVGNKAVVPELLKFLYFDLHYLPIHHQISH